MKMCPQLYTAVNPEHNLLAVQVLMCPNLMIYMFQCSLRPLTSAIPLATDIIHYAPPLQWNDASDKLYSGTLSIRKYNLINNLLTIEVSILYEG